MNDAQCQLQAGGLAYAPGLAFYPGLVVKVLSVDAATRWQRESKCVVIYNRAGSTAQVSLSQLRLVDDAPAEAWRGSADWIGTRGAAHE